MHVALAEMQLQGVASDGQNELLVGACARLAALLRGRCTVHAGCANGDVLVLHVAPAKLSVGQKLEEHKTPIVDMASNASTR